MKKALSIALALVMVFVLAACGGGGGTGSSASTPAAGGSSAPAAPSSEAGGDTGDTGDKIVLKFWSFHQDAENQFLEDAVADFNSKNEKYVIEHSVMSQSEYITTLIPTAYANGEAPDIFYVEPATFAKYAEKGMLADLTPYYTDALKADMLPAVLEAVTYNGQILALPMEMETLGLMYDADALAEAGVEPPTTWDELYEAAKALTNDERFGIALPVENSPHTMFLWYPWMWMAGADILSPDGKECTVDTPEMYEALDFWSRFYKENLCPSSLQIGPWDVGNIGTGVAAMQIGGSYMIVPTETTYADVNIQAVPLPVPAAGADLKTIAGGQKLALNSQSENLDGAAEFIFGLFGGDDITWANRWVSEAKFAYPARQSVIDANQDLFTKGLRAVYTDFYDAAIPEPGYPAEIAEAIADMQQDVMFGGMTSQDAAKKCQERIDAYLEANN